MARLRNYKIQHMELTAIIVSTSFLSSLCIRKMELKRSRLLVKFKSSSCKSWSWKISKWFLRMDPFKCLSSTSCQKGSFANTLTRNSAPSWCVNHVIIRLAMQRKLLNASMLIELTTRRGCASIATSTRDTLKFKKQKHEEMDKFIKRNRSGKNDIYWKILEIKTFDFN